MLCCILFVILGYLLQLVQRNRFWIHRPLLDPIMYSTDEAICENN